MSLAAGNGLTVRELPPAERPRERLIHQGSEALSVQELLACLLGRGVRGESVLLSARRLLAAFGSLAGLAEASVESLSRVHGIGPAKAVQIKAAIELARRLGMPAPTEAPAVTDTAAAAAIARPHLAGRKREHVIALLLDARHCLLRVCPIAVGTLTASLVHPRELFREAVAASAAAVIVAHNHPSGDPSPSAHDLALTRRLAAAGELLGIEVLDHLIVGSHDVISLTSAGVLKGSRPSTSRTRRRKR